MVAKITNALSSFFKELGSKIVNYFKNNWLKLTIITVILTLFVVFIASIVSRENIIPKRDPYDKTGFVAKEDFTDEEIVLSNDRFTFKLDTNNTHFKIEDSKNNNKVWTSHAKGDVNTISNELRELFVLYYERTLEAPKSMSVNAESIRYGNYSFRLEDDAVEILYVVGGKQGLTREDLPERISFERFEEKIIPNLDEALENDSSLRRDIRLFLNQYALVETADDKYYVLKTFSSNEAIAIIHRILFEVAGYTQEDFIEDSNLFGFDIEIEELVFEFSIKYTLTDDGLDIKLINDSIYEPPSTELAYIDILPYFGSGNIDSEGHILIPDGSGVLIDYQNNKYDAQLYSKRVYGSDYANTATTARMSDNSQDLVMPLYGINDEGSSFLHIIEEGASMAFLRAGFRTQMLSSQLVNKTPYSHYRYYLRERDSYLFSGVGYDQQVTVWTEGYNEEDFSSKVIFLDEDQDQTYVGMAKTYQKYLVDRSVLVSNLNVKDEAVFNLTLLGGYKDKAYFLGIPYEKIRALTTIGQAEKIIDELLAENIKQLNVNYQGWSNGGIKPSYASKIKFDRAVGTRKEFAKTAEKYQNLTNVNFIPEVYAQTAYTNKNIKVKDDVIYDMFWENISYHPFNLASQVQDRSKTTVYPINPNVVFEALKTINKTYSKNNFNAIGFIDYGNRLNSSFHKNNLVLRTDALESYHQNMEAVRDNYDYL